MIHRGVTAQTVLDRRCTGEGVSPGELNRMVATAKSLAASCGNDHVLLLPGPKDFLAPEWLETVVRISPRGFHWAHLSTVAAALGRPRNDVHRELCATPAQSFTDLARARDVLLVEGRTDQAVFQTLLSRCDLSRVTVVPAHSKVRLAALYQLGLSWGTEAYVLFDGDGGATTRSGLALARGSAREHRVIGTRATQTRHLLNGLGDQREAWRFGEPSVVGSRWCALATTLEDTLGQWPSFMAALAACGTDLAAKDHRALRQAAATADLTDMPPELHRLRDVLLRRFARRTRTGQGRAQTHFS